MLSIVAEDEGDARDLLNLGCRHLRKAADDDNLCVGVLAVGLADGVAALLLGHGGDGAGVDDVEVGPMIPLHDSIAVGGEAS